MKPKLDMDRKILVIDLELNQPSESIIELGYVIGELSTGKILLRKSIMVNSGEIIAPEIIKLTNITQAMADSGVPLESAYNILVDDMVQHGAQTIIHQWGVPDAHLLRSQLSDPDKWKFGRRWIDVKALAQTHAMINGTKFIGGLRKFCNRMGILMSKENAHRADYDAEMTFRIHCKLAAMLVSQKGKNK